MSAPPPPPPGFALLPDEPPAPGRGRWLRLVAVTLSVLVLVGAAGVTVLLVVQENKGKEETEVAYPAQWAPELMPYVSVVQKKRGLIFRHPVYVDFLPEKTFRDQVTADEKDLTDEDRAEIEQTTGLLRATGLIEGKVDLFDATNKLNGAGIIGYYDFDDERIRMRGTKLTAKAKTTLVHELTHALQDQHFDLGARYEAFGEDDGTAESVFRAIVEGDAERVQTAYVEDLPAKQRKRVEDQEQAEVKETQKEIKDLPKVLATLMGAPYTLGEAMLRLAVQLGDNNKVNELFLNPPASEEQLLDPWTELKDRQNAIDVKVPSLGKDEKEFDHGEFGAMTWLMVLANRLPLLDALDAADGWGGDQYVSFDRGGTSCVRIAYVGDTEFDLNEMERAIRRWIAVLPGTASLKRQGETLLFESCDPGAKADVSKDASADALGLAASRTFLSVQFLKQTNNDEDVSRCLGDRFIHRFTVDELNDPDLAKDPTIEAEIIRIAQSCRT